MKRRDRKKAETLTDQRHPEPTHDKAADHERHISGSVNVRGTIETQRPPDLTEEHKAERKDDAAHNRNKFVVECITLFVVAVYAGLTAWQACSTQEIVTISQKTFESVNRPYIGEGGWHIIYYSPNPDGTLKENTAPTKDTTSVSFDLQIKNFGPLPGTNFKLSWKEFFNGQEMPLEGDPAIKQLPQTLYPTQYVHLGGTIEGIAYKALMDGTPMITETTISYDGPSGHYKECDKDQFIPKVGMAGIGLCN
jgi:hypothetical protein